MNPEDEKTYNVLRKQLLIHINKLHHDAQEQPDLALRAGELSAELKAQAKRRKVGLDEAKASADSAVRASPEHFGIAKITESAVASAVVLYEDVKIAAQEAIDADEAADKAFALANAFEHRRSMISNEVKLYLGNYWGDVEEREMNTDKTEVLSEKEKRMLKARADRKNAE